MFFVSHGESQPLWLLYAVNKVSKILFGCINLYWEFFNWKNAQVVQNVLFNDEEQVGLGQGLVTENSNKTSVPNNCFSPLFGNTVTSENLKVVKFM